ncbi:MAG: hypothetical protein QXN62_06145 [Candidatus Bathyarchaeia archaeon]|nr:hypothetical protein [Candidatus Bathyarchaeota archaeon]
MANKIIATVVILLIYLSSVARFAEAASIEVRVTDRYLEVKIESKTFQNMTAMPETSIHVTGIDLKQAEQALRNSLLKDYHTSEISNVSIRIDSNNVWLNLTIQFILEGMIRINRDVKRIDLGWIPFKVKEDLRAKNISYNLVGQKYIQPFIRSFLNESEVKYYSPIYTPIDSKLAANIAGNITSIDLTGVESKVSSWAREFDVNSKTTTWKTVVGKLIDLRAEVKSRNVSGNFYCYTESNAQVSVNGYGVAINGTILVETSQNTQATLMLMAIVGLVSITSAAYRYEIKLRRRLRL